MRNLKKILGLILVLSLLCGSIGVYAASAGDRTDSETGIESADAGAAGTQEPAAESYEHAPVVEPETSGVVEPETSGVIEPSGEPETSGVVEPAEVVEPETSGVIEPAGVVEPETSGVVESTAEAVQEEEKILRETEESADELLLGTRELSSRTLKMTADRSLLLASVPEIQVPVSEDGMTIEKIRLKWLSSSSGDDTAAGYDTLLLSPAEDDVPNQQWQMDFALSGQDEYEAGTVEIVIPAYIWLDRNGEEPGRLTLAVPEDPEEGMDFSWRRIGDTVVFTNVRNISAASKIMIQGTFRDLIAHEMIDRDVAEGSEYKNAFSPGKSDKMVAQINVTTPKGNTISMTSNEIDAQIDTYAVAASASKSAYNETTKEYNMFWDTPSDIPAEFLPDEPEDYCYVRWYAAGLAEGNQPFVMKISDSLTEEYEGIMLGIQDADGQDIRSSDGKTISAQLFAGYNVKPKTAYIWTAYKKSAFAEANTLYTVHNTQTISVQGYDDMEITTQQAFAECSIASPIGYTVVKEWDDNDNELGLRPDHQDVQIYRNPRGLWKTVRLVENPNEEQRAQGYGEWSYSWTDDGKAYHYETAEINTAGGSFETYYDGEGNIRKKDWSYALREKTYDPDLRKWTYVNTLTVEGYEGDFSDMYKRVHWKYDDPYRKSKQDRAINELIHGRDVVVPYDVWGIIETTGTYRDNLQAGSIDAHRTDVVLEDYLDMLDSGRITKEDVDLAYVTIEKPKIYGYEAAIRDPSLAETDPGRYFDPPRYKLSKYPDDDTDAVFEAYVDGEWKEVAELHGDALSAKNGAGVNGLRISLPEGTEQFRERVSTYGAATELKYTIGVRIHPSEKVMMQVHDAGAVSDYMMMTLDNYAKFYAEENGSAVSDVLSDWDRGYLHGRVYRVAAWQDKEFSVTENDTVNRRVKIYTAAVVTQQSNILTDSEYKYAVENEDIPFTTGGTWYDLLPKGVEPDTGSIALQSGDRIKDVQTVPNYRGSGRTLLIVKADLDEHVSCTNASSANPHYDDETYPKEGYKQTQVIAFDAYISWEDAQLHSLSQMRNSIAFSTADDCIGNLDGWSGEVDDPDYGANKWSRSEVLEDIDILAGLETGRTDPSFVYAGADLLTDELDYAAETSIRKWVSAEGSGLWSYGRDNNVTVCEGGRYTYRVNVRADSETTSKNIIILDSLENFVPTKKHDDYGDAQWRGRFMSLDISPLIEAGADPVIYYSTKEKLEISKEKGGYNVYNSQGAIASILEDPDGDWSTILPDDPSAVTAFAIDCRRAAGGGEFLLDDSKPLAFYVRMRAPARDSASDIWGVGKDAPNDAAQVDFMNPAHNAHAYNNVYLDSTQVDGTGQETHAYIHWDYTKVGIVPFNLTVSKEWDDMDNNDGIRPESAVVKLLADGAETGEVLVLNEGNGWKGSFEHILKYDYDTGEPEYSGRNDGHYISYSFEEEDPAEGYTMSYGRTGSDVTVINTHVPEKISIPFTKSWAGDEKDTSTRPEKIFVRLYADGVFTGYRKEVTEDENGQWAGSFDSVCKYKNGREVAYTVQEEAVDYYETQVDGTEITNTYYPYGDLYVSKMVENGTEAALEREFVFTLVLTDKDGNDLTGKYDYRISDANDLPLSEGKIGNGGQFRLKSGQKMHVADIPSLSVYEVSEDRSKGFETDSSVQTGRIMSGIPAQAAFVNRYASRGRAEIKANKVLTGRALEKYQFKYEVYKIPDEGEPFLIRTGSNREDGSILFGAFAFTDKDDGKLFRYRISERNDAQPGYTYDASEYFATITPHDKGNGTMRFEIGYEDAQGQALGEAVTFRNEYHAEGSISLRAWKQLPGRDPAADEFTFNLYSEEKDGTGRNVLLRSAGNAKDGSIEFRDISFTEEDIGQTFYFFADEQVGEDTAVQYDRSVFGYKVEVADNGDGTLSFSQSHVSVVRTPIPGQAAAVYSAGEAVSDVPLFTNRLKDGTITVSKYAQWEEGSEPDPDTEFKFRLRTSDTDTSEVTETEFVLKAGEKKVFQGIPGGSSYQVWEELPSGWQLLRQENPAGKVVPNGVTEVKFYNQYMPGTATISLMAAKTIDGNVPAEGAFSFELIGSDGTVIGIKSNNAAGIVQFDPITFTEPGSYAYQIKELRGEDAGIDYDTQTVDITVDVTADAAGNLSAVSSAADALPVFENFTKPGTLTIDKHVQDGSATQTFTLEIELTNDKGQPLDSINVIGDVKE